jgi:hypothetical protein
VPTPWTDGPAIHRQLAGVAPAVWKNLTLFQTMLGKH